MATDPKPADQEIRQEVERLRQELTDHNHRYYVLDDPLISDAEYDQLFRRLANLEAEHPELHDPASPTQKGRRPAPDCVYSGPTHRAHAVAGQCHLPRRDAGVSSTCPTYARNNGWYVEYVAEPKIDGVAVELVYENGKLTVGSTRGDGVTGEDVTANLKNGTVHSLSPPLPAFPSDSGADLKSEEKSFL